MTTRYRRAAAVFVAALLVGPWPARADDASKPPCPSCHKPSDAAASGGGAGDRASEVELADAALVNQDGRPVRFADEIGDGHVTVMTFVFTTCTTVCPVLSAIMRKVQDRLGDHLAKDVRLVSVTLDPVRDTPERLKAYAARHRARPEWLWLTGSKDEVERALRGMGAYTANFADHSPMVLVGSGRGGSWSRFNGFPSEEEIVGRVEALLSAAATPSAATAAPSPTDEQAERDAKARAYFTNTTLLDASGKQVRFYDDVLKDQIVLITFMFTRCTGACPLIAQKLAGVRRELGEPLASGVRFVSISVDPEHDTPAAMAEFARRQHLADPRWVFLTGTVENVTAVLRKLGERTAEPTDHSTGFLAANVRNGHWKRIRPDVPPSGVAVIVRELAADATPPNPMKGASGALSAR